MPVILKGNRKEKNMPSLVKPVLASKTMIAAIIAIVVVIAHEVLGLTFLDAGTKTTIVLGALATMGLRLTTNTGIQGLKCIAFLFMLVSLGLLMSGCARNTNSVKGGGTGLVFITPFGQMVLGNAEFHTVTSDLQEERLTITDTTYYEADADLAGEAATAMKAGQTAQRTFTMTLEPVESGEEEARAP